MDLKQGIVNDQIHTHSFDNRMYEYPRVLFIKNGLLYAHDNISGRFCKVLAKNISCFL